jgi:hypothetical protein
MSAHRPLSVPQWAAISIFAFYLLPYVASSYYERYAVPLLAVKFLLVTWELERLLTAAKNRLNKKSRARPAITSPMTSERHGN